MSVFLDTAACTATGRGDAGSKMYTEKITKRSKVDFTVRNIINYCHYFKRHGLSSSRSYRWLGKPAKTFKLKKRIACNMILVSLRNRTAERRGRQNACAWQTWQGCYWCVLSWSSLKLMFSGLLQKDPLKGWCSSAEKFFKQSYCHACHTRFAVFFPLPSCCVSSLLW